MPLDGAELRDAAKARRDAPVPTPPPAPDGAELRDAAKVRQGFYRDEDGQAHFRPRKPPFKTFIPDPGPAVLKGVRDMGVGLATLPTDISQGVLGVGGGVSETIRKNIPQIETDSTASDVGAEVVQFALPAGVAARMAGKAAQNAPRLVQWASEAAAAALADFAVAEPETNAGTLGNVIGGPTAIQEGDSPLAMRTKLGAEAGAITTAVAPISSVVSNVATGIWAAVRAYLPSDKHAADVVAKALQGRVRDVDAAIASIDKSVAESPPGFKPTTGTASGDTGLIGLEKGLGKPEEVVDRTLENREALSRQFEDALAGEGSPEAMTRQARAEADARGEKFGTRQRDAEEALAEANKEVDEIVAELGVTDATGAASARLDEVVRGELTRITAEKQRLFNLIDPDGTHVVDHQAIKDVLAEVTTARGKMDMTPSRLPSSVVSRIRNATTDITNEKGEVIEEAVVTLRDTENMRATLSAEISAAKKEGKGDVVEALVKIKDVFDGYVDIVAKEGGEAGIRARAALDYYKDTYVPRFKQSVGQDILEAGRRGKPIPPTAVGQRFIKRGGGAREAARNLRDIIDEAPDQEAAQEAVRDYLMADFANFAINRATGTITPGRINAYLTKDRVEALRQFPDLLSDIRKLGTKATRASESVKQMQDEIKDLHKSFGMNEREARKGVAGMFIEKDPVVAVKTILASSDPGKGMREAVTLAKRDKSGEALKGLRYALGEHIDTSVRSASATGGVTRGDLKLGDLNKFVSAPKVQKAMGQLYTPAEMKALKAVRDKMEEMRRIDLPVDKSTITLDDKLMQGDQARVLFASMFGLITGRAVFQLTKWGSSLLGFNPTQKIDDLYMSVMLDPELAKLMLLRDTPVTRERLKTYIANNLLAQDQEDQ